MYHKVFKIPVNCFLGISKMLVFARYFCLFGDIFQRVSSIES